MKINIGIGDRFLRVVIGLIILAFGYFQRSWWGLIGLLPLLTAAIRFCPAYLPFGLSTCAKAATEEKKPGGQPGSPA
ncbi:MAG: DUF2892 domain-containing protein [Opitutales bacterium]